MNVCICKAVSGDTIGCPIIKHKIQFFERALKEKPMTLGFWWYIKQAFKSLLNK